MKIGNSCLKKIKMTPKKSPIANKMPFHVSQPTVMECQRFAVDYRAWVVAVECHLEREHLGNKGLCALTPAGEA